MILAVDARRLGWNEAGELHLVYRGPHDLTKLYRLRVSDQGIAPTLLATASERDSDRARELVAAFRRAGAVLEVHRDGNVRLLTAPGEPLV